MGSAKMRAILLGLAVLLTGCVSSVPFTADQPASFQLVISDNPQEKRFDLLLVSEENNGICLTVEQWPNEVGGLHFGSQRAFLETPEGNLPAADENFGHCPGGCGLLRVEEGGELKGHIPYSSFGPESQISETPKRLIFEVQPFICRATRDMPVVRRIASPGN